MVTTNSIIYQIMLPQVLTMYDDLERENKDRIIQGLIMYIRKFDKSLEELIKDVPQPITTKILEKREKSLK